MINKDEGYLWDMYCAAGEYQTRVKDLFDRTLVNYSREGNMLDPSVSSFLFQQGFQPSYPKGEAFATCISHDVDFLYFQFNIKSLIKGVLRLQPKHVTGELKKLFSRIKDPICKLENMFKQEKKYGIKSSFYFLSVEKDNKEDFNYLLDEISAYFKEIEELGSEVGLHGSKLAYNNAQELGTELQRLTAFHKNIVGYRNHYLKFEIPTTWNLLAEAGFKYDTTFGAPNCPGFRNGMCYPFQPFDLNKQDWIPIYELPLIAMDVSFFYYLKLTYDMGFELFKSLVEIVKDHKGVFTFLWHNNHMAGDMRKFYGRCLDYLAKQDTWFSSGDELIQWWDEQNYFAQQKTLLKQLQVNAAKPINS